MPAAKLISDNGVLSGVAGIQTAGGSDGSLLIQTTNGSGVATTAMTLGTDQSVSFAQAANLPNTFGFKNRIINGAMMIDQRNAGASVTINNSAVLQYVVDRFYGYGQTADGVFTLQQNSSVPTGQGFTSSLKATVTTADASIGASQLYQIGQRIEGYNVADFELGLASAATFTFSFWVRSSLTGTFGGALQNGGQNRSYPFSYTISAADTWEKKTITLTGDTSGTWLKTNGTGLEVIWGLGVGSTYLGTANAWAGSYLSGVTGQTQVISTVNATFYITGVQLEKGTQATSFDFRSYGTELALCQRYYQLTGNGSVASCWGASFGVAASNLDIHIKCIVPMRATPSSPTLTSGTAAVYSSGNAGVNFTQTGTFVSSNTHVGISGTVSSGGITGLTFYLNGDIAQLNAEL